MSHSIKVEVINKDTKSNVVSLYIEMYNRFSADIFYTVFDLNEIDLGGFPDGNIVKVYNPKEIEKYIEKYHYLKNEPYTSIEDKSKNKMVEEQALLKLIDLARQDNIDVSKIQSVFVEKYEEDHRQKSDMGKLKGEVIVYKIKPSVETAKQELDLFFDSLKETLNDAVLVLLKIS